MNETKETNSEGYVALEMPIGMKSIRMPLKDLKRFCRVNKRPFFVLQVEEQVHMGMRIPVENPRCKYFTIMHDWVFWAAEKLPSKAPERSELREEIMANEHTVIV